MDELQYQLEVEENILNVVLLLFNEETFQVRQRVSLPDEVPRYELINKL